jgi:elongation factor Ts
MSQISAAAVKKLRDMTNAPMMDCKAALIAANGDFDLAVVKLRETNAAIQAKKGERETAEGRIAAFVDPEKRVGAIIEVRCESAPVAKSEGFVQLANDLAKQVAVANPATVETLLAQPFVTDKKKTVSDRIGEVIGLMRENMKPARFTRLEGLLGEYVHHDGMQGAIVQVEGTAADSQMLRDVSMHVTARNPVAALREHVDPTVVEKEKELARTQAAATGKPAQIVEKIAEGKLKTFFAENVLHEQPFVRDDSKTVGELLKSAGLKLVRFVRYRVGDVG